MQVLMNLGYPKGWQEWSQCYFFISIAFQMYPAGPGHSELFLTAWSRWTNREKECWALSSGLENHTHVNVCFILHYFMQTLDIPILILTSVRTYWQVIRNVTSKAWRGPFTEANKKVNSSIDATASTFVLWTHHKAGRTSIDYYVASPEIPLMLHSSWTPRFQEKSWINSTRASQFLEVMTGTSSSNIYRHWSQGQESNLPC